ncbi:unnamed protein product [Gongylonema pulchrum]|uniref:DUF7627 domain-containing protein n=1 Tax=Gongylonema pulchrum TaxID=637853 RepID=A0A3P7M6I2_9BILA|nr:unnamed protein product [Gongylonema pulchrum]
MSNDNVALTDEDWSQFACHVVDAAMKGNRELAVDIAVIAIGHESFQSTFAERIKEMMSNYVLSERKAEEGIVELIALLLITKWPREHARCGLESNAILFSIISSIKGWLMAVIGETDEVEEVESSCACALYEVCRYAQRKMWMNWPELVDECYDAAGDALTSNITLSKEARKALLDALIMIQGWTSRNAKTLVNVSTQTEARKALLDALIMIQGWTSRNAKTLVNVSTQTYKTRI